MKAHHLIKEAFEIIKVHSIMREKINWERFEQKIKLSAEDAFFWTADTRDVYGQRSV